MTQAVILDASAVLAFLQGEPGSEMVEASLQRTQSCLVTAANQAEIISKGLDRGIAAPELQEILDCLGYQVIPHPVEDGQIAGHLRRPTRQAGLSLGDRLCLAAAQRLNAQVLTADRAWLSLAAPLQLDIRCIRPEQH